MSVSHTRVEGKWISVSLAKKQSDAGEPMTSMRTGLIPLSLIPYYLSPCHLIPYPIPYPIIDMNPSFPPCHAHTRVFWRPKHFPAYTAWLLHTHAGPERAYCEKQPPVPLDSCSKLGPRIMSRNRIIGKLPTESPSAPDSPD